MTEIDPLSFPAEPDVHVNNPSRGLQGQLRIWHLDADTHIKSSQIKVSENVRMKNLIFEPSLRIVLLLQGDTRLFIGSRTYHIQAKDQACGLWMPMWETVPGEKHFHRGDVQNELVLFIGRKTLNTFMGGIKNLPAWLREDHPLFAQERRFEVTSYLHQLIDHCREDNTLHPLLARLRRKSLCLQILAEVCRQFLLQDGEKTLLAAEAQKRVERLNDLLHSGRADDWTLARMAEYCHSNVTTLQRHFRQMYGMSISRYLSRLKLERAYQALQAGCSVSRAAEIAGYRHVESFSKAFKRHYRCSPLKIKLLV